MVEPEEGYNHQDILENTNEATAENTHILVQEIKKLIEVNEQVVKELEALRKSQ